MNQKVINFLLFQLGWFSCVIGAAKGFPLVGLSVAALVVTLHINRAPRPASEIGLLLICALTGLVFDSALLATGWVAYPNGGWIPGLAPYWIVAMWLLFGTTLSESLSWLQGRWVMAAIAGAVGGPLSYLAGEKLGAIELVAPTNALLMLGLGWGVMMPLLAVVARPAAAMVKTA